MSDPTSIFEDKNQGQPPQSNNAPTGGSNASPDTLGTLLASIKNERGEQKYKTVEAALEALNHAQNYIPTLKNTSQELEQKLQEALEKAAKVEELERVVQQLAQSVTNSQNTNGPVSIDEGVIADLVNKTLTKTQVEAREKTNLIEVVGSFQKIFGDKAEETFYSKGAELGMSREQLNSLAKSNPKVVLKLFGISSDVPNTTPTLASVNTGGFTKSGDSNIRRNDKSVLMGASTQDVIAEREASKAMVEELHSQGMSVNDLTSPKVYFKHFGNR